MLDEKNDNLPEADGNLESVNQETTNETNSVVLNEESETNNETAFKEETDQHLKAIDSSNAEESEDNDYKDRHSIPMLEYENMSMEDLVIEFEKLLSTERVLLIKDHVEEVKKAFLSHYHDFIEDKKEAFLAENNSEETFEYHFPLKNKFDELYDHFKDLRNKHYKNLQRNLESNLENRLAIVEELKELINPQENIKDTLKHFNELRERWKNAGPIPRDKYNHVWNNYHFHVENFYDYLHLDREARDLDFKHNLELKTKIIHRVKELIDESDLNKAFRELQDLHRIWKEDIGPVAREIREEIWNEFSALTKQMHDKREVYFSEIKEIEKQNLAIKHEIIAQIDAIAEEPNKTHSQWQNGIEKIEALRTAFFAAGKVPIEVNEETWAKFKTAVRKFNANKNNFYKEIKSEQHNNLLQKQALVAKAESLKDSEDFASTTPIMKQIQDEWKKIGHVPRKFSDPIWKEFKNACNHYFDRMKQEKSQANNEEIEAFDKKKAFLEELKNFELVGEHKEDLAAIKSHIETWKSFGRVPVSRRHIEGKFNKILDTLFDKLSLSKKEGEMLKFSNKLEQLVSEDDNRKIINEKIYIQRKIEEIQSDVLQLENNIQFFSNAKKGNPLVNEVLKNIERNKEELKTWKEKLKQIKKLT